MTLTFSIPDLVVSKVELVNGRHEITIINEFTRDDPSLILFKDAPPSDVYVGQRFQLQVISK